MREDKLVEISGGKCVAADVSTAAAAIIKANIYVSSMSQFTIIGIRRYVVAFFQRPIKNNVRRIPENAKKEHQTKTAHSSPLHGVNPLFPAVFLHKIHTQLTI